MSGKTVYLNISGFELPIRYAAGGTIRQHERRRRRTYREETAPLTTKMVDCRRPALPALAELDGRQILLLQAYPDRHVTALGAQRRCFGHGADRRVGTHLERFDFLLLLLLPALLKAMATACFCGLPAFISVLMFELTVLRDDPFLSGMEVSLDLDHVEQIEEDDCDDGNAEQPQYDSRAWSDLLCERALFAPESVLDAADGVAETRRAVEAEGRRCILLSGDVADADFCKDAVERTVGELGKLDILVNNAAFQEHVNSFEELTDEHFDRTIKTNLYGYFFMAKAAVPHMQYGSAIVMTGSVTGLLGNKDLLDYSMTKGGIHAFTRSLATHLVDRGIRVNAVAPGPVWTPLNPADKSAERVTKFGADTPMKRPAQPEEIAPAFVFLAAPSCSSYITGEVLPIIGGYSGG